MEEGHELAARAVEGLLINQSHARASGLAQLALDIICAKGKVMIAAGGILLQKLGNGAIGTGRFEQFQMDLADREKSGADFLRRDFLAVLTFQAEGLFIIGHGLVEGWDCDSEMVNFCDHNLNYPIGR
jgi:hypothetical protein